VEKDKDKMSLITESMKLQDNILNMNMNRTFGSARGLRPSIQTSLWGATNKESDLAYGFVAEKPV